MQRITLQVGSFEVNCSILSDGTATFVVDPGAEGARIVAELERRALAPSAILLTHAHFDHIGAVAALQAKWPDLPVYVHPDDIAAFTHPLNCFPPDYPSVARPANLRDAREFPHAAVIETPGHTPGGVCYHFAADKLLLSGDTLFAGSVGRTDFPGGSMPTLLASLQKLTALPDDTRVVPGHGPETTIRAEKDGNPFLK